MGNNLWLHRFAVLVAVCTLLLIFVGALVTSTGSGLAVPDWPLSYGQLFPEMVGGVFYEHGHRMVAATVGLLTLILAIWLWKREPRKWVRLLGIATLLAVIAQGVLGGVTVLMLLPTAISVSHAALAQLFLCLTVGLAVFTSRTWQENTARIEDSRIPSVKSLSVATTLLIYLQILIGALMRHTASGLAIPDFPLAYGRVIPPFFTPQILVHFAHRLGALVVTLLVFWLAVRIFRSYPTDKRLGRPVLFLVILLGLQIALGAETIWSSRATTPTTLHVAVGTLALACSFYLSLVAWKTRRPVLTQPRQGASWQLGERLRKPLTTDH